jgi:thiosulfate/3-mercaptopyruvate sulfurtransferase
VGVTPKVDTRARYLAEHIPGALFFDIEEFSDHATSLPHMLPALEIFCECVSAIGIGNDMTIVVYEQEGVFSAPRAWWMFKTFGVTRVYLLDGGLRAWTEAGLPAQSGEVRRKPASFHATFDRTAVKDFSQMQQEIADHGQILDARSAGRFAGSAPEPRPGLSSGHMPGATNIRFTDLVGNGRLKSAEQLSRLFDARGVDRNRPVTTTCGSGVTAAVIALGLTIVGSERVSLYDGSWAEYAAHPEAVIQKSDSLARSSG